MMKILQGGVPKCGNFWLYQIIQQILERIGNSTTSFIEQQPIYRLAKEWDLNFPEQARIDVLEITDLQDSYRISSIYRKPVDNLKEYISQTTHVWTHSPICKRSGEVLELFDKKVYIIRDPRDRALSAAKYYCSPYMLKYFPQEETDPAKFLQKNYEQLMHEWVWHVFDHLRLSSKYNIHICFYEGFLLHFQQELDRLLVYLELELSQAKRQELESAVSFSTLKKQNPKHLKKGTAGYWLEGLTDEQVEKADTITGPLLQHLGYPRQRSQHLHYSPQAEEANINFEQLKLDIIESQQPLYQ
ncbi:sulfotransferase domain-containing protein [Cesiribacter sp. SM1]|uniref:sulfotransferase domain-containing protein n=1 Tax=Cesiribacter sp. SM1 TaxID=2861196 RepID=UPI001CD7CE7A|nr:sulfotransferase domain-containing protein [Cesiribacter sp. SM1]